LINGILVAPESLGDFAPRNLFDDTHFDDELVALRELVDERQEAVRLCRRVEVEILKRIFKRLGAGVDIDLLDREFVSLLVLQVKAVSLVVHSPPHDCSPSGGKFALAQQKPDEPQLDPGCDLLGLLGSYVGSEIAEETVIPTGDQQADDLALTPLSDVEGAQLRELLQELRVGLIVRLVVARHAGKASSEASGEVVSLSSPMSGRALTGTGAGEAPVDGCAGSVRRAGEKLQLRVGK
jgi:hypothetical protein